MRSFKYYGNKIFVEEFDGVHITRVEMKNAYKIAGENHEGYRHA
jgi:hypothetical protein